MRQGPILVFAGPSLPPSARPADSPFAWRPPAVAGDGLAALAENPGAVVLIDGLFDRHPAIRHKELLALVEAGVPVIGGASMGALRAAELHTLGMIGVGAIFEAYARGRLTGDDEVAVLHGPQDMDWAALTIPLVNVRATILRAVRERVIGPAAARTLRAEAAAVFFQDRTWPLLLEASQAPRKEVARLTAWVGQGQVDLKRRDALACLSAVANVRSTQPAVSSAPTVFTTALARQVEQGRRPTRATS